jgi:ribonuclease HI
MYNKLILFSDGGARGNPGPAGIGVVIFNENKEQIAEISEYIGETTNNQAEYRAIIAALGKASQLGAKDLECFLDSELVVKQLNGEYKVKNKDLQPRFLEVKSLLSNFSSVRFSHVRREANKLADALANKAMDNRYV